ncbi:helix-turn-helix domain-containing protein, partial [Streptomyces lividans]
MTRGPATPLPPPKERRRLRESAALTQPQLATQVGVAPGTVRAWESGRTTPRGRKREAYAKLLKTLAEEEAAQAQAQAPEQEPKPEAEPQPQPELEPQPQPQPVAAPGPTALTPAQAFDALYAFGAPALVRQTFLLTGRREQARESVERAFQAAWERWPEVARDRDPVGWVRATAYEYALSPWQRFRPRHRHPEPPPADPGDRTLLNTLLRLPARHRRTLMLY